VIGEAPARFLQFLCDGQAMLRLLARPKTTAVLCESVTMFLRREPQAFKLEVEAMNSIFERAILAVWRVNRHSAPETTDDQILKGALDFS
jgi:hypothetical protein